MDKKYLLIKYCRDGSKKYLTWLTAADVRDANQAAMWLRTHHPENPDLQLGDGEFFEVLEQDLVAPQEWEAAMRDLSSRRGDGQGRGKMTHKEG